MRIVVVGSGYVGLVTGACLADAGLHVVGVDIDAAKVERLRSGEVPIFEPGLDALVRKGLRSGRLRFTTDLAAALDGASAAFIAVGTPPDGDGQADLRQVMTVARDIGRFMTDYLVVITKSTVPVGTAQRVREAVSGALAERGEAVEFDVASNPEFLKEGAAIDDFQRPERIVVGVDSERAEAVIERIYRSFILNGNPLMFMDVASAEITKYAANAMLATWISFMNQIASLCDAVGADVHMVRRGIGSDSRIGSSFLYAGAGYGGSCFPKDVRALIKSSADLGVPMPILEAVETVNQAQKLVVVRKLRQALGLGEGEPLAGVHVAVWGLAFKPNTDDVRDAPAISVVEELLASGATVAIYDPVALSHAPGLFGDRVRCADDPYDAADGADALLLVTEWSEFRNPDYDVLAARMRGRTLVDGRNVLDAEECAQAGFPVVSIGRPGA